MLVSPLEVPIICLQGQLVYYLMTSVSSVKKSNFLIRVERREREREMGGGGRERERVVILCVLIPQILHFAALLLWELQR